MHSTEITMKLHNRNILSAAILAAFIGAAGAQTTIGTNAQATGRGTIFISNGSNNCAGMNPSTVGTSTLNGVATCTVTVQGSTAVGQSSLASGAGSTATGEAATASGLGATAHGAGANALGNRSVANGSMAFAGTDNSVSVGAFSQTTGTIGLSGVQGSGGTAVGFMSSAVNSGTAVGIQTSAVDNSVALGANSAADQANTVSVGSLTNQRRIVNVATGVADTDAANTGQVNAVAVTANSALLTANSADSKATTALTQSGQALTIAQQTQAQVKALTGRVDALDTRVSGLESRMDGYDRRVDGGVAIASAMNAAVAPSLAPGESALLGGIGSFRGQAALSMGVAHTNYSGQSITAKWSTSSIGTAFAIGGAVKF